MSKTDIVGFDRYSIREMEQLWTGIELFHFYEGSHRSPQGATAYFVTADSNIGSSVSTFLKSEFGNRIADFRPTPNSTRLILDKITMITLHYDEGCFYIFVSCPNDQPWTPELFQSVKQVDAALQKLSLTVGDKPEGMPRSFFRGEIVPDTFGPRGW